MSSQPKTIETQKVEDKAPWAPAQPYFLDIYGKTQTALNETNKNPFTGDFIAQPGQDATTGLGMLRSNASNPLFAQGVNAFQGMAADTAAGKYLDPNTNPFIQAVAGAATRPLTQNFQNTVLPAISDQAIEQGAYGGSGSGIARGQASDALMRNIGDITSNIFYQNYNNERNNQLGAGQLIGQGSDLAGIPGQTMLAIDAQQRALQQMALDNQRQQFMEQKTAPWYGLGEASTILSQGGFNTVTGNYSQTNPNYVDPFTNALKIGLGGASMVAGLGGGGGFNFWGPKAGR